MKDKSKEPPEWYYLNDSAKDYGFSDWVQVTSFPHGMILRFGKFLPEEKKFGVFQSIALPFDVANSLLEIISQQFRMLEEKGLSKREIADSENQSTNNEH